MDKPFSDQYTPNVQREGDMAMQSYKPTKQANIVSQPAPQREGRSVMQQAQSQSSSTSPIGCIGWSSVGIFAALILCLLFRILGIMGVVWGIGAFGVVFLLLFIARAQTVDRASVDNSPVYFLVLVLACVTIPLVDRPAYWNVYCPDLRFSFIDRPIDCNSPFYSEWIDVAATRSLKVLPTYDLTEHKPTNMADAIRKALFSSWREPDWSFVNRPSSTDDFLMTYAFVGGIGTAAVALWLVLLVGTLAIGRSGRSAIAAVLVILFGLMGVWIALQAHYRFGLLAEALTSNDMLLLSTTLVIAIGLVGFFTTVRFRSSVWAVCDLITSLSGFFWLTGLTIMAMTTGRSSLVLGILGVIWLLLILGAVRFNGTREWTPRSAKSRKKPAKEIPMSDNRSQTQKEYVEISADESRQHQGDLDALIDDQIDVTDQHKHVPFRRGDIRIYRSYVLDLFRRFRIKEGRQGVLICNGRAVRVLEPGAYHVLSFPWFQKIELRIFDSSERSYDVSPKGTFTVFYDSPFTGKRIHFDVWMEVVVRYQVVNPIHLFKIGDPLQKLFDTTVEAIRIEVDKSTYESFLRGGNAGEHILTWLKNDASIEKMGLSMNKVQLITRTGDKRIDGWIKGIGLVTVEDIYQELDRDLHIALEEIKRKKGEAVLNTVTEVIRQFPPNAARQLVQDALASPLVAPKPVQALTAPTIDVAVLTTQPQTIASAVLPTQPQTIQERLQEEVALLTSQGVAAKLTGDTRPFRVDAVFLDADRMPVKIVLECPENYPHQAPTMRVERGERVEPFTPDALRNWATSSSLFTLVAAARQAFE